MCIKGFCWFLVIRSIYSNWVAVLASFRNWSSVFLVSDFIDSILLSICYRCILFSRLRARLSRNFISRFVTNLLITSLLLYMSFLFFEIFFLEGFLVSIVFSSVFRLEFVDEDVVEILSIFLIRVAIFLRFK